MGDPYTSLGSCLVNNWDVVDIVGAKVWYLSNFLLCGKGGECKVRENLISFA